MKTLLKKALLNLAMIQTMFLATALNIAVMSPIVIQGSLSQAVTFIYLFLSIISLIPSIIISILFAYVGRAK